MLNLLTITLALTSPALASCTPTPNTTSSWSGWQNIKQLFAFGDSYTQTGFDPTSTQPSPSNPFGNPPYPGWTSSNGPNWLGFLTTTYNQSTILTYNMAYGGATVDSALVKPYADSVVSMKDQVEKQFVPIYRDRKSAKWNAEDSLFAFWIGINDVGNSWWLNNATLYDAIFATYTDLLSQLHATGARNYLFLSVPPVNLSPLILNQADDGYAKEYEGYVITDWNNRLARMVAEFTTTHAGVRAFVHDAHALFSKVIGDPGSVVQTRGLRNVDGFCGAYKRYVIAVWV